MTVDEAVRVLWEADDGWYRCRMLHSTEDDTLSGIVLVVRHPHMAERVRAWTAWLYTQMTGLTPRSES